MDWKPEFETVVQISEQELNLYAGQDRTSAFRRYQHPQRKGIHKSGEFPVAVMRRVYDALGYRSWVSGQSKLGDDTYLLTRLPGKRRQGDEAYKRIIGVFGDDAIRQFDKTVIQKRKEGGFKAAGGDPDLFVFHPKDRTRGFFVEVKLENFTKTPPYRDSLNEQQLLLFPLIEEHLKCPVRIARVQVVAPG
jgi:hypothetical protein